MRDKNRDRPISVKEEFSHMDQYDYALPQKDVTIKDILVITWRYKFLIILMMASCVYLSYYATKHMKPKWQANAQMVVIQRGGNSGNNTFDPSNPSSPLIETPDTQVTMMESDGMAIRTINLLKNEALAAGEPTSSVTYTVPSIESALTVDNPRGTNILNVSMIANNPDEAAKLANTVCDAMVAWKTEIAQSSIQTYISTLKSRTDQAKKAMDAVEQKELQFKNTHHLVDLSSQTEAELKRFQTQQQNVDQLQQQVAAQQALADSQEQQLKSIDASIMTGTGIRDDTLVAALQTKLNDLEMQRVQAAQKYTEAYPGILPDLDQQIADVKTRLHDAIQNTLNNQQGSLQTQGALLDNYNNAETTLISLQAQLNAAVHQKALFKKATMHIPAITMDYAQLSQASDLAKTQYAAAKGLLDSARFDLGKVGPNVQVMQQAVPSLTPVSPNVKKIMMIGTLVGIFLCFGLILILEQSDKRLRSIDDVLGMLNGPVVGTMPKLKGSQIRRISKGDIPPEVTESCSLTRAHLGLALRKHHGPDSLENRVFLFTSAMKGEGKSMIAFSMAQSFARSGKTVILVDADIRRPSQNKLFNTEEPIGLANVIEGDVTLDQALVSTDIPQLTVLHSGSSQRNPSELLSQKKMGEIIVALRKEAEIVIIDSPACSVVADALFLAPLTDTIFYIIGMGTIHEDILKDIAAELGATTASMFFFVNRAAGRVHTGYGSSYYYYYSGIGSNRNGKQGITALPAPQENEESAK